MASGDDEVVLSVETIPRRLRRRLMRAELLRPGAETYALGPLLSALVERRLTELEKAILRARLATAEARERENALRAGTLVAREAVVQAVELAMVEVREMLRDCDKRLPKLLANKPEAEIAVMLEREHRRICERFADKIREWDEKAEA